MSEILAYNTKIQKNKSKGIQSMYFNKAASCKCFCWQQPHLDPCRDHSLLLFVLLSEDLFCCCLSLFMNLGGGTWQVHSNIFSCPFTACFLSFLSVKQQKTKMEWNYFFPFFPLPHLFFFPLHPLSLFPSFWRLDNLYIHEPELR